MSGIDELKTQAEQAYRRGELKDALTTYRRLERLRPADADIVNDLGTVLFAIGDMGESTQCYRRALDLNPSHEEARRNLQAIRRAVGASSATPILDHEETGVSAAVRSRSPEELPSWTRVVKRARRLLSSDRPRDAFRAVLGFRVTTGRKEATEFLRRRFRGTRVRLTVVMDQGIGNMVMLTPTLKAITQALPRSRVEVVGHDPALEVVEGLELADACARAGDYSVDPETDALLLSLWANDFAARHMGAARQLRCPVCGLSNPFVRSRAAEAFARKAGWPFRGDRDNIERHEVELQMDLARVLGYRGEACDPECAISQAEWPFEDGRKVALLADTAAEGEVWQRKRWPHFPELAKLLLNAGYQVGAIGGPVEASRSREQPWPTAVRQLEGRYSVSETADLIRRADLLVANDSGPAHIGAAVETETFVLFGPTMESKSRPWGGEVHVLSSGAGCRPCQYLPSWKHCERALCMEMLKPERVMAAIRGRDIADRPRAYLPERAKSGEAAALVKVDIGCGLFKRKGFIGIDVDPHSAADIVCDVRQGIPLADDSVDYLVADNVLEHIGEDFVAVMNEIWRVCRTSGKVEVTVPVFPSPDAVSDPTHARYFTENTFNYLDRNSAFFREYGQSYGFRPFDIQRRRKHGGGVEVVMSPFKGALQQDGIECQRARKPRVCFVSHNQPLAGGGERAIHNVANRLVREGYEVRVIYNRTPFIHSIEVGEPEDANYAVEWVAGKDLQSLHEAIARAVEQSADGLDICMPLWRANSGRLITTCRENNILVGTWCQNVNYPPDERSQQVFAESDFVVAVSPYIEALLERRFERTRDVFVIPNAADDAFFENYRERTGEELNRLVFFGRLSCAQKGLDVLCKALAKIKEDGQGLSLDVVGTGPDEEKLRSIVGLLGLGEDVRMLGWKTAEELAGMLPAYDLCVLPSNFEGCSLAVIEAMATGTPVVSTTVGGTPWIVTHRKDGLLVPAGRPDALAEAVRWAREHPAEVNLMGRWGYKKAAKRYHWDAVVARYAKVLHGVCTR